ncbi:hypothetical protein OH76DRAFT_1467425 [Lentinus brumalis]|uniref:Uncharacterized protein n=1 Tax=Lentinus brumalis TaxID=2498619 RepID=A0A371CKD5_9APHY|nr:hypothetical protein OH76DRAFT_1467425 [Polyporus brumalis]
MFSKRTLENAFVAVAIIFLALNAAFKLATQAVVQRTQNREPANPLWPVERKEVLLEMDSWTRFTLDSGAQWAPLFPDGGIIHLGPGRTPYTVSMMHQLRCLNAVRDQLTRPIRERDAELTRHCLNYLRQMVTCRGDLQVDPYQYAHNINAVHPHAMRRCKDWGAVYEKVWENQREYRAAVASSNA